MPFAIEPIWIDIIVSAVFFFYALNGLRRGFILIGLELIGFFLSLLAALFLYGKVGLLVANLIGLSHSFANAVAFFLVWIATSLLYPFASRALYLRLPEALTANYFNKLLGFLPSLADAFILLSVALTLMVVMPIPGNIKSAVLKSRLGGGIAHFSSNFNQKFERIFNSTIHDGLAFLTVHPKSDGFLELRFQANVTSIDEESETEMFRLVNIERRARGLKLLIYNAKLRELARGHAEDMARRGYFSHRTPENKTPADRALRLKIKYRLLGENLALAPDVIFAQDGLMDSPGHRANILSAEFRQLGIGVIDAGIYGKMFVQEFSN